MTLDIFNRKRIPITGHTGFKGSWLALWLSQLGAEVHGHSLPPNMELNHYTAARIHELMKSECLADLRSREQLMNYIHKVQPDCIFHLASPAACEKNVCGTGRDI